MNATRQALAQLQLLRHMPHVTIDLMYRVAQHNDEFFRRVTEEYYAYTQTRIPKFPLLKRDRYGVALCVLPEAYADYFKRIESSGRRNVRKAKRNGYVFERIDFNTYLEDVAEIWRSTAVRQGEVPEYVAKGEVKPCRNPPSKTNVHDYPYFGVLKDGKLVAYAGCLVSGELCAIEQIYGHADYQRDGVVPLLIVEIVDYALAHYPAARFFTYDTFLGAAETLKRFKKKFGFVPHKVTWELG